LSSHRRIRKLLRQRCRLRWHAGGLTASRGLGGIRQWRARARAVGSWTARAGRRIHRRTTRRASSPWASARRRQRRARTHYAWRTRRPPSAETRTGPSGGRPSGYRAAGWWWGDCARQRCSRRNYICGSVTGPDRLICCGNNRRRLGRLRQHLDGYVTWLDRLICCGNNRRRLRRARHHLDRFATGPIRLPPGNRLHTRSIRIRLVRHI
jgi:hypothetical protein